MRWPIRITAGALAAGALAAGALAAGALAAGALGQAPPAQSPDLVRLARGRFAILATPGDLPLARALLSSATRDDTFPGLPRPTAPVLITIAPDGRRFRRWAGADAPDWGAALAVPDEHRVVMQGHHASSDAGDPIRVLRHELAHMALHETLGDLPPRWFDEGYAGYAAREWGREEALATSVALLLRGLPSLDSLDAVFQDGMTRAGAAYALSYRAVSDLAALDPQRGFTLFFRYWSASRSMDRAMREAYGVTLAAFNDRWRRRTLHRYGVLAIAADVTAGAAMIGSLLLPLYVVRRRRDRRRLEAMIAADQAAEQHERETALDELLRSIPPPAPPPPTPP
jgi:hypothetical protein